jgi:hypothetical protein
MPEEFLTGYGDKAQAKKKKVVYAWRRNLGRSWMRYC